MVCCALGKWVVAVAVLSVGLCVRLRTDLCSFVNTVQGLFIFYFYWRIESESESAMVHVYLPTLPR